MAFVHELARLGMPGVRAFLLAFVKGLDVGDDASHRIE
jgi:hypothetical protein